MNTYEEDKIVLLTDAEEFALILGHLFKEGADKSSPGRGYYEHITRDARSAANKTRD